jgi:hypoxanthine phosphoribosyltransferase
MQVIFYFAGEFAMCPMPELEKDISGVLITEEQIREKVAELGKQITKDYEGKKLLVISILKGAVVFMSDLIRQIDLDTEIDFMVVSSYGSGTKSTNSLNIRLDLSRPLDGCHVLIAEDVLDSGNTLSKVKNMLLQRQPASLKICAFLDKPSRRTTPIDVDYRGFVIPDEFGVCYGLDYDEKYRNLPFIGILDRRVYE